MSWFWVIVIAVVVIQLLNTLNKRTSKTTSAPTTSEAPQPRPNAAWASTPPPRSPDTAWAPPTQPGAPGAAWTSSAAARLPQASPGREASGQLGPGRKAPGWQNRLAGAVEERFGEVVQERFAGVQEWVGGAVEERFGEVEERFGEQVDVVRAGLAPTQSAGPISTPVAPAPTPAVAARTTQAESVREQLPAVVRDRSEIGSAALESTLDSSIESSLFGATRTPPPLPLLAGASTVRLPADIHSAVMKFLDLGQEVAAVSLVRDKLDVDILDAMRTVRELAGGPVS